MEKFKVIHLGISYEFEAQNYTVNNKYGDCYEFFVEKDSGAHQTVAVVPKKHTVILMCNVDMKTLNSNINIIND